MIVFDLGVNCGAGDDPESCSLPGEKPASTQSFKVGRVEKRFCPKMVVVATAR
jgi:hypothetical protein